VDLRTGVDRQEERRSSSQHYILVNSYMQQAISYYSNVIVFVTKLKCLTLDLA
jgi:hypothetical protein